MIPVAIPAVRCTGRRAAAAVVALAAAGLTAACSGSATPAGPGPGAAAASAQLSSYYRQHLTWTACPGHPAFGCAWVRVPLNYADPSGATMRLAVNRLPATSHSRHPASLLVNPGGPGGSGLDEVYGGAGEFKELLAGYQVVGLDPRGTGLSDPVKCLSNRQLDAFYQTNFDPATSAQRQQAVAALRGYARACGTNSGRLLRYVGSENVARDMDIVRAALGDQKLNFFGTSYGTLLGQLYAHDYPDRVGRMVLDSVVDPAIGSGPTDQAASADSVIAEAVPVDRGIAGVFRLCAGHLGASCPTGPTAAAGRRQFTKLLVRLAHAPEQVGGRKLTASLARIAAIDATYSPDLSAIEFTDAVARAVKGEGRELLGLADSYLGRGPGGHYQPLGAANLAVNCLVGDPAAFAHRTPASAAAEIERTAAAAAQKAPITGQLAAYLGAVCDYWPVPPTSRAEPVSYRGGAPIVLANNTGDPATPLHGAQQVAGRMRPSRLIVNQTSGHTVYGSDACASKAINNFLLHGRLPASGLHCR